MKSSKDLHKLVALSVLAAIGTILMAFIEIKYPPAPFLKIEFSDIVILIAFALFGFKSAFLVAVVKTLGDLLFQGATGPLAIGQISALVASMSYVLLLKATKLNIKEDGIKSIVIKSIVIVLSISLIMSVANYFIITPVFAEKYFFFNMQDGSAVGYDGGYLMGILITYIPFNLIKGALNLLMFYLIGPRLISIYKSQFQKEKTSE